MAIAPAGPFNAGGRGRGLLRRQEKKKRFGRGTVSVASALKGPRPAIAHFQVSCDGGGWGFSCNPLPDPAAAAPEHATFIGGKTSCLAHKVEGRADRHTRRAEEEPQGGRPAAGAISAQAWAGSCFAQAPLWRRRQVLPQRRSLFPARSHLLSDNSYASLPQRRPPFKNRCSRTGRNTTPLLNSGPCSTFCPRLSLSKAFVEDRAENCAPLRLRRPA